MKKEDKKQQTFLWIIVLIAYIPILLLILPLLRGYFPLFKWSQSVDEALFLFFLLSLLVSTLTTFAGIVLFTVALWRGIKEKKNLTWFLLSMAGLVSFLGPLYLIWVAVPN